MADASVSKTDVFVACEFESHLGHQIQTAAPHRFLCSGVLSYLGSIDLALTLCLCTKVRRIVDNALRARLQIIVGHHACSDSVDRGVAHLLALSRSLHDKRCCHSACKQTYFSPAHTFLLSLLKLTCQRLKYVIVKTPPLLPGGEMTPSDERSAAVTRSDKPQTVRASSARHMPRKRTFNGGQFSEDFVCAKRHARGVTP